EPPGWALRRDRRSRPTLRVHLRMICLTATLKGGTLRGFLRHESLSYHRIQSGARQRDSPARLGQEERRCRPPRHEDGAAHFRAKFATPAYLGAGIEEVRAYSRYRAWSEDNQ